MGLPEPKNCCFVIDLKTGNIIMGALNLFISFTLTVIMIVAASEIGVERDEMNKEFPNYKEGSIPYVEQLNMKAKMTGAYALIIILMVICILKTILNVVYIYGVVKEHQGIIKTYLIIWIVLCIISIFTFFFNLDRYGGWHIAYYLFFWGLNVYAILLGRSFYKSLNCREDV